MEHTEEYTVNDLIRDELYKNMDTEYGKFTASLIPNCGNIIGVRLPVLRSMAKEIASVNWKEYLDGALDDTFEEVMLQGLVLGYARGNIEDILAYLERFIPKIDNWSVCDSLCNTFKITEAYRAQVWEFLMRYMGSGQTVKDEEGYEHSREFELRFVAIMMMNYYLVDEYIDRVLDAYNTMQDDGYYLKMGVAWGIATAYVKYPEKTLALLKENNLDDFTFHKAIQKMQESYRISKEEKTVLKSMKRESRKAGSRIKNPM